MLVLTQRDVESVLEPASLIDTVAAAMVDLTEGRASMPQRIAAQIVEREAILGAMPAYLPSAGVLSTKLVSVFPQNPSLGLPSHQAVIVVFSAETGTPIALLDGTHITESRTAAGAALSTRLLAREDADSLAILGTGVQARAHARFVPLVRSFREIRVAGRDPEKARAVADELGEELGRDVHAAASFEEAAGGASVVCATTHSPDPVLYRDWVSAGAHVTSVGVNPTGGELDPKLVADALVVVESRAAALAPYPAGANDLTVPIRDGLIGPDHVHAELGELLNGTKPGRTSPEQVTLYKSVGVAVQDAAAAGLVLRAARERGLGKEIDP